MHDAERSTLWQEAFAPKKNDPFKEVRARLQVSMQRMRENVSLLLTMIPADCKHLTVHDITHLDALWELASTITGQKYEINPAEVFVLGGAIMLHDAGLSTAAFAGGLGEIKATQQWTDISSSILRENSIDPTNKVIQNPPSELLARITFAVLRAIHARQAERMASAAWQRPGGGEIYLIEDLELRQAFSSLIGRVAHSHNWDIEKVAAELLDNLGTGTMLPSDWAVSERKVACILRCADAAHIDRRRAPTFLYAANQPIGISDLHWNAQNKINKPSIDKAALVYTSGQPFKVGDADAWWLAYDLAKVADKEIRGANALLDELKFGPFKVQRVFGAENPRSFSTYVRADGWKPIDAEVKVSDPIHLARTLGGRNLYGGDPLAPVKEILQNAADAIRARRLLEDRGTDWGLIRMTLEPSADGSPSYWLHVDDDGIGMSERVLSGPLIDFGKSIWTSNLIQEEFPGLQSKRIKPIGKFGIGFFSIFELGNHVRVVSKKFEDGIHQAKVLEFKSLLSRPIVRSADQRELPRDASTRISVLIESLDRLKFLAQEFPATPRYQHLARPATIASEVLKLVAMLDIRVEFNDKVYGSEFIHLPDVYASPESVFFDEILPDLPEREREQIKSAHGSLLAAMQDNTGTCFGRAAIRMVDESNSRFQSIGQFVSVGGFIYSRGGGLRVPYVGVIEGETEQASRDYATSSVPREVISAWATRQAALIDQTKFMSSNLMRAAENIVICGGDPGSLPFAFASGKLISYSRLVEIIQGAKELYIPLANPYSNSFQTISHASLTSVYFEVPLLENVIVLNESVDDLVSEQIGYAIAKQGRTTITLQDLNLRSGSLSRFYELTKLIWSVDALIQIRGMQIFRKTMHTMPPAKWVLCLSRKS